MDEHHAGPVIKFHTLQSTPWRNGGGLTREIATHESKDGEGFDWRLSLATLKAPGRFSGFPGMERIFTVVEGDLVTLAVDGRAQQVLHGIPFRFWGDSSVQAALPAGRAQALNVIFRPSAINASVVVERLMPACALPLPPGRWGVLLSGQAALIVDGVVLEVGIHDTVRGDRLATAELVGEGLVAVVSLHPQRSPRSALWPD